MADIFCWATCWAISNVIKELLPVVPLMNPAMKFFREMLCVESSPKSSWLMPFIIWLEIC